jgi:hypothetical protein
MDQARGAVHRPQYTAYPPGGPKLFMRCQSADRRPNFAKCRNLLMSSHATRTKIGSGALRNWRRRQATRLEPPTSLSEAERTVFIALVNSCGPTHFKASDMPLLSRYCEQTVLADLAATTCARKAPWRSQGFSLGYCARESHTRIGGAEHATAAVTASTARSKNIKPPADASGS